MVFKRFYANPPKEVGWPYIIRHLDAPEQDCVHEIVDIKISDLLIFPHHHSDKKLRVWEKFETDGWKVVPDCFDIKGEFGIDVTFDTLEYSKVLLMQHYTNDPNQMPVIQGYVDDYQSFNEYISWFKGYYDQPLLVGVSGSAGRAGREFCKSVLKLVRREFPRSWVHVFALNRWNFRGVWKFIDSFDSSNWTRPRGRGVSSASTKVERIKYFYDFVEGLKVDDEEIFQHCISDQFSICHGCGDCERIIPQKKFIIDE